jgi:hypothetical protein
MKNQQIHQLFFLFINCVWWLLHVSALHCHVQGAFLVPYEGCSIEEQSIEYCGWDFNSGGKGLTCLLTVAFVIENPKMCCVAMNKVTNLPVQQNLCCSLFVVYFAQVGIISIR